MATEKTSTEKTSTEKTSERTEWRLHDKDGQPWIATTYAEAFSLMCQGYTLENGDLGVQVATAPPSPAVDNAIAAQSGGELAPPPKSGAGSGRDAWAGYAEQRGVTVPDGASRDDIVTALERANVPTEAVSTTSASS